MMIRLCILVFSLVALSSANSLHLYRKADGKIYQKVLVPVSSTVIPLDNLPQYQVGVGVGVVPPKHPKPTRPEGEIKLITVNSKNKKPVQEKKKFVKKDYYAVAVEEIPNES